MNDPKLSQYAVAEALRNVTDAMQTELDKGRRSSHIDANDLIEVLLSIADQLDPPLRDQHYPQPTPPAGDKS
ncbi:MAG: hypothetical protein AB7O62_22850 [Pirellulales bacterium]